MNRSVTEFEVTEERTLKFPNAFRTQALTIQLYNLRGGASYSQAQMPFTAQHLELSDAYAVMIDDLNIVIKLFHSQKQGPLKFRMMIIADA